LRYAAAQPPLFLQTLSSIDDFEEEADEEWFTGNGTRSGSSHMTLSPLEEWESNDWQHENEGRL
jgi:hypothetical protein